MNSRSKFLLNTNARTPLVFSKAKGVYVWDTSGKKYLDLTAGQVCSIVGHCNDDLVKSAHVQSQKIIHIHSGFYSEEELQLAEKIAEINANKLNKSFFLTTGGEAVELAMRLAKLVTGKYEFVSLERSWHGLSSGCSALTGIQEYKKGTGPFPPGFIHIPAPDCYRCPYNLDKKECSSECLDIAEKIILSSSSDQIAAFVIEPVLAAGGIIVPPKSFFTRLKTLVESSNSLLIFDECQTGLGRTGKMFCYQHYGIEPDILILGKGLGGGYPISAVVTTEDISNKAFNNGFKYITSHMCDPFVCALALETINIIQRDNLVNNSLEMGNLFSVELNKLKNKHRVIGDIRGLGLMIGIEIVKNRNTKTPGISEGNKINQIAQDNGLIMNIVIPHNIFRIVPPIIINEEHINNAIEILDYSLSSCVSPE
ncbi:MAG: aspartate aminotransferase family protein [Patescibacteria group bacterium]|jgi:2,2-dialkylglycine decarboxylase (pyruvate)|nr:aspartate aminotransferase family protein [Patescibacteria group bacterium]